MAGRTNGLVGVARSAEAALVVIDVQERLASVMQRRGRVLAETSLLIEAAALCGVPVLVTRQYPKGLGDVEPALAAELETVAGVDRTAWHDKVAFDCLADEAFAHAFAETGRRQLIIAGMETHICVAQTALHAVRLGLEVHVAADACCSRVEITHTVALDRMRSAGVVVSVAESVAYELVGEAGTDDFRRLLSAVKKRDSLVRLADGEDLAPGPGALRNA